MYITYVGRGEYRVEFGSEVWFVNYCDDTRSCPGSIPEKYWDSRVERRMTEEVEKVVANRILLGLEA